jgi:uncharacterized membrane protein
MLGFAFAKSMMAVPTPPKELKLGRVLAAVVAALVTAEGTAEETAEGTTTADGVTPAIGLPLLVGITGVGSTTGGVDTPAIGLPLPVGGVTAPPPVGMPRFSAF